MRLKGVDECLVPTRSCKDADDAKADGHGMQYPYRLRGRYASKQGLEALAPHPKHRLVNSVTRAPSRHHPVPELNFQRSSSKLPVAAGSPCPAEHRLLEDEVRNRLTSLDRRTCMKMSDIFLILIHRR